MKKIGWIVAIAVVVVSPVAAVDKTSFEVLMEHYEPIRLALIGDSMDGVNRHGEAIVAELRSLQSNFSPERAGVSDEAATVVRETLPDMIEAADTVARAKTLQAARDGFYALSKPMVRWREGVTENDRPSVAYCPMHKRSWLQPGEQIGNPYGGMPDCGSIVSK